MKTGKDWSWTTIFTPSSAKNLSQILDPCGSCAAVSVSTQVSYSYGRDIFIWLEETHP